MLAKVAAAAPLPSCEALLRQVMGMPGLVASVVEALRYLPTMAFDVMTFVLLRHMASPRKKLKARGQPRGSSAGEARWAGLKGRTVLCCAALRWPHPAPEPGQRARLRVPTWNVWLSLPSS